MVVDPARASARFGDADAGTELADWAGRAVRTLGGADMLAEGDEQAIDLDPVPLREPGLERREGLLRCPGVDVAPAIGDAVHVDIDRDPRLATADRQHQIGALGA